MNERMIEWKNEQTKLWIECIVICLQLAFHLSHWPKALFTHLYTAIDCHDCIRFLSASSTPSTESFIYFPIFLFYIPIFPIIITHRLDALRSRVKVLSSATASASTATATWNSRGTSSLTPVPRPTRSSTCLLRLRSPTGCCCGTDRNRRRMVKVKIFSLWRSLTDTWNSGKICS